MKLRSRLLGFGLAAFGLGLDQIAKHAVLGSPTLVFGGVIELTPQPQHSAEASGSQP